MSVVLREGSLLPFSFWDTCAQVKCEVGWQWRLGCEKVELQSQAPLRSPHPAFRPLAGFPERLRGTLAAGRSRRWPCVFAVSAARYVFGFERNSSSACSG